MFRRKKKQADDTAAAAEATETPPMDAVPQPDAPETADAAPPEVAAAEPVEEPAASEPATAEQPAPAVVMAGNGAGGDGGDGNGHRGSAIRGLKPGDLLSDAPRKSEEQRQQEAAAELMAAIAPSQEMLMKEVPDASSPDDAASRLMDRQNERPVLPDPEGERLVGKDLYQGDATVYYRLQKRFTWGPQRGPYQTRYMPTALAEPKSDTTRRKLTRGR
ncbi:MAG: hypothetical protein M3179_13660 [Actinomycetota bacterium]|nr:hypothetical protein [Actinomycetota bacterium]